MPEIVNKPNYQEDSYMDQLEGQIIRKPKKERFSDSLLFFILFFLFFIIVGVVIGIYGALYFKAS
ncbi:MAG: hypothetical protein M3Q44_08140 [bacterium]|nr:hypothetical protein [bacterium]